MSTDIFGSVAGAVAGPLIGEVFGGGEDIGPLEYAQSITPPPPTTIRTDLVDTGFIEDEQGGVVTAQLGPRVTDNLLPGIRTTRGATAAELSALAGLFRPGGPVTQNALDAIQRQAQAGIGNLRDSLARRRVLGSSFGADALTRANLAVGDLVARRTREFYADDADRFARLLTASQEQLLASINDELQILQLPVQVAQNLAARATTSLDNFRTLAATLAAQAQQGVGQFSGSLGADIGQAISSGISSLGNASGPFGFGIGSPFAVNNNLGSPGLAGSLSGAFDFPETSGNTLLIDNNVVPNDISDNLNIF